MHLEMCSPMRNNTMNNKKDNEKWDFFSVVLVVAVILVVAVSLYIRLKTFGVLGFKL